MDRVADPCHDMGLDGATWSVEQLDGEKYRFIQYWSPQDGPVREFGEFALGLTGWHFGEIY